MNTKIKTFYFLLLSLAVLSAGCAKYDEVPANGPSDGNVGLNLRLFASQGATIISRADPTNLDPLMAYIDNVHVLMFDASDNIVYRNYFDYGVEQKIYLKSNSTYRIYVVANLDADNPNIGNAATFFNDVNTLDDLEEKYIVSSSRSVEQVGKMVMTSNGVIDIELPDDLGDEFTVDIPLSRLNTKMIFNIYNKVNGDGTNASGVFPISWNAVNVPRSSYLMERNTPDEDYPMTGGASGDADDEFISSQTQALPSVEPGLIPYNGNTYTKQTFFLYTFENRRGDVSLSSVNRRKADAPAHSTYVQINSNTNEKVLITYVHPGKGRASEPNIPDNDDINNYDIDRSCIYHMNVYINGINDVSVDTRREYLDQQILFMFPDVSRIDGHYIDIPSFITGQNGYVKLQSGTCDVDAQGNPIVVNGIPQGFVPMDDITPVDATTDARRWLRFSFYNPYRPSATTNQYIGLRKSGTDAYAGATTILHFNEFIDQPVAADGATNPKKRTAVIRVGYVPGATSRAEYDEGKIQGEEVAFYTYVSQWGVKTIGSVGGFQSTSLTDPQKGMYTQLLGVESVEEYSFPYYTRQPDPDVPNAGPYWQFRAGAPSYNHAYDGKQATANEYDDYRSVYAGGVPPTRNGTTIAPPAGYPAIYNPSFNTNAADYCMRKNRDENGDGIISDDEVKWYLATPVQMGQMGVWKDYLKYQFDPAVPFAAHYNTTNRQDADNALVYDFTYAPGGIFVGQVIPASTTVRTHTRCVRDMPGTVTNSMIYNSVSSGAGHIAVNLTGNYPETMLGNKTGGNSNNTAAANQIMQRTFIISRWYLTGNTNHSGTPLYANGNADECSKYSEPGYPAKGWALPSQRELSFINAYAGWIEGLMAASYTGTNAYHNFILNTHWGITDVGDAANYWIVDFATGYSQTLKKGHDQGYFRCVYYLPAEAPRP